MNTLGYVVTAVLWAISGILAYGITFAYFQGEYPFPAQEGTKDRTVALQMAIAGPVGLLVAIANSRLKHGLKWKGKP